LVLRLTRLARPRGPAIVLAHSGGFRTAAQWTKSRAPLRQIHLIDGLYGSQVPRFKEWVSTRRANANHQLVLTSTGTADRSALLAAAVPGSVQRERIPEELAELSSEELRAPLLFMRSQYEHMELVTGERVIPFLLRLAPLEDL
jgi:hypothetical protein